MMIWTTRFSRKKAVFAVLLLGIVLAAIILLAGGRDSGRPNTDATLLTNEDRVAYLQSLGWEVDPEPVETLLFLLPDPLEEPYLTYNALQLEQGFDLSDFCGRTLSRYTYVVTNYPDRESGCQADIYLCDDAVVAGDIVCTGEGGFMTGLKFPDKQS